MLLESRFVLMICIFYCSLNSCLSIIFTGFRGNSGEQHVSSCQNDNKSSSPVGSVHIPPLVTPHTPAKPRKVWNYFSV